jgi:hypothetical protein
MKRILEWILCAACAACAPSSAALDASAHAGDRTTSAQPAGAIATAAPSASAAEGVSSRAATVGKATLARSEPRSTTFVNAVLISVDGLRSDALRAVPASELPNFHRFLNGASTLNARTDPDYTVTLPNHTDMLTGRPVLGPSGHGWIKNDDAERGETLHKNHGSYIASMFDVAHDRGLHTALFAGKTKFAIYDASYDAENGAPASDDADRSADVAQAERVGSIASASMHGDAGNRADVTGPSAGASADGANARADRDGHAHGDRGRAIGEHGSGEHGRRKIDAWKYASKTDEISELVIASLASGRSLVFAHYAVTDLTGHASGWDVTPRSRYMQAVAAVDKDLGRILDAIEANEHWRGKTAIVLTADHGGGAPLKSHDQTHMWVDYIIPFLVWTGDGAPGGDLYALNAGVRRDPGITSPRLSDAGLPPIRNGEAGNLLLSLLGLPPVPGSVFDAREDLKIH